MGCALSANFCADVGTAFVAAADGISGVSCATHCAFGGWDRLGSVRDWDGIADEKGVPGEIGAGTRVDSGMYSSISESVDTRFLDILANECLVQETLWSRRSLIEVLLVVQGSFDEWFCNYLVKRDGPAMRSSTSEVDRAFSLL